MSDADALDALKDVEAEVTVEFADMSDYIAVLETAKLVDGEPADVVEALVSEGIREYKMQIEQRVAQMESQQQVEQAGSGD